MDGLVSGNQASDRHEKFPLVSWSYAWAGLVVFLSFEGHFGLWMLAVEGILVARDALADAMDCFGARGSWRKRKRRERISAEGKTRRLRLRISSWSGHRYVHLLTNNVIV